MGRACIMFTHASILLHYSSPYTYPIIYFLFHIFSHKNYHLLLQMATPDAPIVSDTFLNAFGTPTLLWRVLHLVGYVKPPRYIWKEVETQGQ
jgi:hypothetical protein